jgi:hypothetical protein
MELAIAVALAYATVGVINSLVQGLVRVPIQEGKSSPLDALQNGYVVIFGRQFDWLDPVLYLLAWFAVFLLALYVFRRTESDDPDGECPYCLAAIPSQAAVCSYCTREVTA